MGTKATRIRNWSNYNKSLVQRGNITLWIQESFFTLDKPSIKKRGRPKQYQDALIDAGIFLKNVFHLSFRALEGFLQSIKTLMKLECSVPNYTTLYRRQNKIAFQKFLPQNNKEALNIVVDSTGLKIIGEGEWCRKKHERAYQRTWRKIHLAVDAGTMQILSNTVTTSRAPDGSELKCLLDGIKEPVKTVIGDGAYDKFECYEAVQQRKAKGIFPPQNGARLSSETKYHKKAAGLSAINQRDEAIRKVRARGKKNWKEEVGYHKRSLAETTMYRLKYLLGERLRSKKIENQEIEVQARCHILNLFSMLGRPERNS